MYQSENEGDTEVGNTFQRLVCLFTDPPGQLGCDCEQGHRLMAQTLRDPGPLRLNIPDIVDSLPGLPRGLFGTWSTKLMIGFSLWYSKCNCFPSKIYLRYLESLCCGMASSDYTELQSSTLNSILKKNYFIEVYR